MRWAGRVMWLLPVALAVVFWWFPPRGDDAYYHSVSAVEQVRAWQEGAFFPGYHRGWNGGTGSFAPTVYAPIPMAIQGGLAWLVGDGQRAVGLSLAMALLAAAAVLYLATARAGAFLLVATPYVLVTAVTRATTTEAWALAGAAVVLALGMPGAAIRVRNGLALAAGIFWVAGSQIGMLVQLGWLVGIAWLTGWSISRLRTSQTSWDGPRDAVKKLSWAVAGLLTAAIFWLPTFLERRNLALGELVTGAFDWRENFLPGNSELTLFFSVTAVCLGVTVFLVLLRGDGERRIEQAIAASTALLLTVWLSTPLWNLPGMDVLQFPWRFLGPATILMVMALGSLRGRWLWLAVALLVVPSVAVPLRLDSAAGHVPVGSSPGELARNVHENWGLAPVLPSARGLYAPEFHRLASLQELGGQASTIIPESRTVWGGTWRVTAVATPVLLPLQWWPEWSITVDGRDVHHENHNGLVAIDGVPGTATVRAVLRHSKSRAVGGGLSLLGVMALAGLVWFYVRVTPVGESL